MNGPALFAAQLADLRRRTTLAALWVFVLLNMIFRDLHELAKADYLESLLTGTVSDPVLLVAGITLTVAISMVPLNTMLNRAWGRPANLIAATVIAAGTVLNAGGDLDDGWFTSVELIGLGAIAGISWKWPAHGSRQNAVLRAEPRAVPADFGAVEPPMR